MLELAGLADESGDAEMAAGVEVEQAAIAADYERLRTSLLFSGPYDERAALLTVTAGAGGDRQQRSTLVVRA